MFVPLRIWKSSTRVWFACTVIFLAVCCAFASVAVRAAAEISTALPRVPTKNTFSFLNHFFILKIFFSFYLLLSRDSISYRGFLSWAYLYSGIAWCAHLPKLHEVSLPLLFDGFIADMPFPPRFLTSPFNRSHMNATTRYVGFVLWFSTDVSYVNERLTGIKLIQKSDLRKGIIL